MSEERDFLLGASFTTTAPLFGWCRPSCERCGVVHGPGYICRPFGLGARRRGK